MELIAAVLLAGPLGYFCRARRQGLGLYLLAWAIIFPIQTIVVLGDDPGAPISYFVVNVVIGGPRRSVPPDHGREPHQTGKPDFSWQHAGSSRRFLHERTPMHARTAGHMPRMILTFLAIAATGTFVAGCGDDEETASKDAAAPAPASFAIEATAEGKKKALTFPATVKAGVVTMTLTNSDTVSRSAGIVRLLDGHTVEEFRKAVAGREGVPIPDWIEDGGGLPGVEPGATATVTQVLAPGRYGISDDETEGGMGEGKTFGELGAEGEFTVTGAVSDAELPAQPATLIATDDGAQEYGFEFEGLKAGNRSGGSGGVNGQGGAIRAGIGCPLRSAVIAAVR